MEQQDLIGLSERLYAIGEQCTDLFSGQLESLRRQHGVDSPQHLVEALESLDRTDRLLNIGFVGRVKAGKSSLLNALFFDGESVLPKAATPMTAALTTLTFGEHFAAEVELFGDEDIKRMESLAKRFQDQLADLRARYSADILKRHEAMAERTGKPVNHDEVRRLAEQQALNEMRSNTVLAGAYEQVQLMRASGVDPSTLTLGARLSANGPEQLVAQLLDYVGAQGRYMPFTKIVHVQMPLESLRDICVIDTPGTNDPVVSREERTISLLKACDVVFIVSPAGRFLDLDDQQLLNRITLKEGVQELVLVGSQIDSQLHDSEKRARLDDALSSVCRNLSTHARRILSDLQQSCPEGGAVLGALLGSLDAGLLHSAGICLTLERQLHRPETWGSEERKAWDNLVESYPDYFNLDNPELSRVNLAKLAGIEPIRERLEEVRLRKDEITRQKLAGLLARKTQGLEAYRAALVQLVREQANLVKNANIEELRKQLDALRDRRDIVKGPLDHTYQDCIEDYQSNLRQQLESEAAKKLERSVEQAEKARSIEKVEKSGDKRGVFNWVARKLWDGGRYSYTDIYQTVMTGQVVSALDRFLYQFDKLLSDTAGKARRQLDSRLSKVLIPVVVQSLEDLANSALIARAITQVLDSLNTQPFDLALEVPSELRGRGNLERLDAKHFLEEADEFVASLGLRVEQRIGQFIYRLRSQTPTKISNTFLVVLEGQIKGLEEQVNNAAQTLDRLERTLQKIEGALSR
ncbi:dynamin family protein [Pseudomonas sp. NY15436]|uniref:dynamin family protein n=1 Tax=Pseudomonas sp. NY15436 TaxID=3400359 RepID=UPI003A878C9D